MYPWPRNRRVRAMIRAAKVAKVAANAVAVIATVRLLRAARRISLLAKALVYQSRLKPRQMVAERLALNENTTRINMGT